MGASEIDVEQLRELSQFYSDRKVGDMFGVCAETIRKRRIAHGICPGKRRSFDPDKSVLEDMYQAMSMRSIAEHFGVGETVVWKRIKEHGISLKGFETGGHRRKPGRKLSESHLANLREAARKRRGKYAGANSPNWKGGISGSAGKDRRSAAHREWRDAVLAKASYRCEDCGVEHAHHCDCCGQQVQLHAHHIKPYSDYPELRNEVDNGVALCPSCHKKRHA